jgi:transcriptional regulator with XRE-family HTH domain
MKRVRTKAQAAREAAGLSLEAAAKRAGLSPKYLRQLERNGSRSFATAERLARIYRCRVDLFLLRQEQTDASKSVR